MPNEGGSLVICIALSVIVGIGLPAIILRVLWLQRKDRKSLEDEKVSDRYGEVYDGMHPS